MHKILRGASRASMSTSLGLAMPLGVPVLILSRATNTDAATTIHDNATITTASLY